VHKHNENKTEELLKIIISQDSEEILWKWIAGQTVLEMEKKKAEGAKKEEIRISIW
jgi:hypothetical protein